MKLIYFILNKKKSLKTSFAYLRFSHFAYAFFPLSYFLYYLSLEKCYEGIFKCSKKFDWIHKKMLQAFFSSIITAIIEKINIFLKYLKYISF